MDHLNEADAERARKKIDKEKIKCSTKNEKLAFLKRFFKFVESHYHFRYDSIFLIDEFRDYSIKRQVPKEKIVEFNEFIALYQSCTSSYFRLVLLTFFLFGLRISELLGLMPNCFDFEKNTMEIYHQVYFEGSSFRLICPKTPSSKRINSIPELYAQLVKEHIQKYHLKKDDFIFFHYQTSKQKEQHNKPAYPTSFRRDLERHCRKYNPDFHPHMLRSSIVTHLKEKGISLEEISQYIGHSDTDVTKTYYLKESKEKEKSINEVIEEMLKEINPEGIKKVSE